MKNIIAASILLSLFIIMVFSFPYIQYWAQSYEASHTAQALFWLGMVVLVIGLICWRDNIKQQERYSERHKQGVADSLEYRKSEIKELAKTGKIDIKV